MKKIVGSIVPLVLALLLIFSVVAHVSPGVFGEGFKDSKVKSTIDHGFDEVEAFLDNLGYFATHNGEWPEGKEKSVAQGDDNPDGGKVVISGGSREVGTPRTEQKGGKVPGPALNTDGTPKEVDGGTLMLDPNNGKMGTIKDAKGTKTTYAPDPEQPFNGAQCGGGATGAVKSLAPNSWSVPAVGQSASLISGNPSQYIPNAPTGVWYNQSAPVGSKQGATVEAGHVNLTEAPAMLSPWGYLHKLHSCDRIFQSDSAGKVTEYVVTDLYTVPQSQLPAQSDMFRSDGPPALYMVTCSGRYIGDAGGYNMYYDRNLVVKAVPVS